MADINTLKKGLIVTAFWEAKPGEVDPDLKAPQDTPTPVPPPAPPRR